MGLDLVEVIMEVEDGFGIVIADEEPGVKTVGQLIDYVEGQLAERDPGDGVPPRAEIASRIRAIISVYLKVPAEDIKDSDRFYGDLILS